MSKPSIVVLGVGNILMKDEGAGVEAAKALIDQEVPDNVAVIDGATEGLDLLPYFSEYDYVIIIDVVKAGDEVGAIYRFSPEEAKAGFSSLNPSLHDIGIIDVWNMACSLYEKPARTVIYAIAPKEIEWGIGLTSEIADKIPDLVELVAAEIDAINEQSGSDRSVDNGEDTV